MAVDFEFRVYGDRQVDRTLDGFARAAADMSPAWERLRVRFLAMERRQFASIGNYGSGGWRALSPAYARWKARHYPGKPILRRTDELYRSLTQGPQISILLPRRMILGSAVPYGRHHQAPTVPGRPPRRRPIELPASERREWIRVIQAHLVDHVRRG